MAENRERLVTDIMLDIEGHEKMLEIAKSKVLETRGMLAHWRTYVCSHAAILRDLHKELGERTGEPTDYEPELDAVYLPPRNVWHTSDERPEDDSQVLIVDGDGWGTAGDYRAEGDYFAAKAGGVCDDWNEWHITRWAYIKDLLPEEITQKDSKQ